MGAGLECCNVNILRLYHVPSAHMTRVTSSGRIICETYNSYDAGLYLLKMRIANALQSPMVIIVINIKPTIDNIVCHLRKSNI